MFVPESLLKTIVICSERQRCNNNIICILYIINWIVVICKQEELKEISEKFIKDLGQLVLKQ